jgi:hypothetical protein
MKKIKVLTKIVCIVVALGILFIVTGCSGAKIRESYKTTPSEMSSKHVGQGEQISINQQRNTNAHPKVENIYNKTEQTTNTVVVVVIMEKKNDKIIPHFYIKNEKGKWTETNQIPTGAREVIIQNKGEK